MNIIAKLKKGQLVEMRHPLDLDLIMICKRFKNKVFTTCFDPKSKEVMSARFESYDEWKKGQVEYYNMCCDSDRHFGDGTIFNTELI